MPSDFYERATSPDHQGVYPRLVELYGEAVGEFYDQVHSYLATVLHPEEERGDVEDEFLELLDQASKDLGSNFPEYSEEESLEDRFYSFGTTLESGIYIFKEIDIALDALRGEIEASHLEKKDIIKEVSDSIKALIPDTIFGTDISGIKKVIQEIVNLLAGKEED